MASNLSLRWATLLIAALFASVLISTVGPSTVATGATSSCPDVVVIGARGSGEVLTDQQGKLVDDGIGPTLDATYANFKAANAARGISTDVLYVDYPALAVNVLINPVLTKDPYAQSILVGIANAAVRIKSVADRACLKTPQIVMMGYSQGAVVVNGALARLSATTAKVISAVLLFGDPMFDPRKNFSAGGVGILGGPGLILSIQVSPVTAWWRLVPVIRVSRPLPAVFADRAYDYCYPSDPVCQFAAGWSNLAECIALEPACPHLLYGTNPPPAASGWLQAHVRKIQPGSITRRG